MRSGATGGRRSSRPPALQPISSGRLIEGQHRHQSLSSLYGRGGGQKCSDCGRWRFQPSRRSRGRWPKAARGLDGLSDRPWRMEVPHQVRTKVTFCPSRGKRYIEKENKLSVSDYSYVRRFDIRTLSTPCLLARAVILSLLRWFITTPFSKKCNMLLWGQVTAWIGQDR